MTLASVPLRLCLSSDIPGCCPPARASAALAPVFAAGAEEPTTPWEVKLAAALVWACRQRRDGDGASSTNSSAAAVNDDCSGSGSADKPRQSSGFAAFWQLYMRLLPSTAHLNTLTFHTPEELSELQDSSLEAEALAWQSTVLDAYRMWIDTPAFRAEAGPVTLREWLRAVGAVESRAFGFRSDEDGRELHAYVPFFCLANYAPGAPTLHVLRLEDPGSGQQAKSRSGFVCGDGGCGSGSGGTDRTQAPSAAAAGAAWEPTIDMVGLRLPPVDEQHQRRQQVFIDYGKKDNRALVLQYGFVLYGNPYDRLDWNGAALEMEDRTRREWVHEAAETLAQEVERAEQDGDDAAVVQLRALCGPGGAVAMRTRLRSAATSIVLACGWRNLKERRQVTPASEARAITVLTDWAAGQLHAFPTDVEQDEELLLELFGQQRMEGEGEGQDGEVMALWHAGIVVSPCAFHSAVGQSPLRRLTAVQYRMERKLLLRAALALLQRLLGYAAACGTLAGAS